MAFRRAGSGGAGGRPPAAPPAPPPAPPAAAAAGGRVPMVPNSGGGGRPAAFASRAFTSAASCATMAAAASPTPVSLWHTSLMLMAPSIASVTERTVAGSSRLDSQPSTTVKTCGGRSRERRTCSESLSLQRGHLRASAPSPDAFSSAANDAPSMRPRRAASSNVFACCARPVNWCGKKPRARQRLHADSSRIRRPKYSRATLTGVPAPRGSSTAAGNAPSWP